MLSCETCVLDSQKIDAPRRWPCETCVLDSQKSDDVEPQRSWSLLDAIAYSDSSESEDAAATVGMSCSNVSSPLAKKQVAVALPLVAEALSSTDVVSAILQAANLDLWRLSTMMAVNKTFWMAIRGNDALIEQAIARLAEYCKTAVASFLFLDPKLVKGGLVKGREVGRRRPWSAYSTELVLSLFRQHGRAQGRLLRVRACRGVRTTEYVARRPNFVLDQLERAQRALEERAQKLQLKRQREQTAIENAARRAHYAAMKVVPRDEFLKCVGGCERVVINPKNSNIRCGACVHPCIVEGCSDSKNGGRPKEGVYRNPEDKTKRFCRVHAPEEFKRV